MAGDRIVIVAPNWLGDAVMALPAFADIRRHFSGARLTVAARPPVAPLFSMVQGVDDIMTLPGGGGWRAVFGWQEDARALQGKGLDIAILLPNSFATALIVKNAAIPERWGFATDGRGRMLTRPIPKPSASAKASAFAKATADKTADKKSVMHQSEYYRALTTALGIAAGPPFAAVRPDVDRVRELALDLGLDTDEPFVVFAPGAAYGRAKQWLPERFAQLAALIINDRGWTVIMVGSQADRPTCAGIAARVPATGTRMNRLIDLSGKTDLPMLAGVMSRARAVVSNDSGAMHLAGAVGARVVAIFGASNERRTAPLRARAESPEPRIVTHQVFCRPCMLRECPIDHRCMSGISAHAVLAGLE
jgi:heptosyltransferase II